MEEAFLCLHVVGGQVPIVDVPVAGNLPAIATIVFNNLWKVIVDGIEFQPVAATPFNSVGKCFANTAGPENEFVAVRFPLFKVIDKCLVGFTTIGPFAKA